MVALVVCGEGRATTRVASTGELGAARFDLTRFLLTFLGVFL